jgi:uroporphyrinogen decarboxylase
MTSKERVLAALKWEKVDRLPVFAGVACAPKILGRKMNREFLLDGEAQAESQWQAWRYFGDDLLYLYNDGAMIEAFGADSIWPDDDYPMIKNILIKTHADADALPVPDPHKDPFMKETLKAIRILKERADDKVLVGGFVNGIFNLTGRLMGTEALMKNLVRDPELVHKVCGKILQTQVRYAEAQAEAGADHVLMPDATSSPSCLSHEDYVKWALPYLTKAVKGYQAAGLIVTYHPCGGEYPIIDKVAETGADILNFSELVDLAVAQKIFVGRRAVAGTVNPSEVLFLGTPEETEQHVKEIIARLRFKTGAILTPGCGLSANIPYENVKAMVDAVKKFG